MAGYTRQTTFTTGNTIEVADFNNEYNQLLAAFVNTTGHKHDGTAAEGPVISVLGDSGVVTPLNKIVVDTASNHLEFYVDVSSAAVQQLRIQDGAIVPILDNDIDVGTNLLEFKDAYFDGTVNLDTLVIGSSTGVTSVDTDITAVSASDDTLASAKAIKTYVDAQVTASDLDFSGDSGGAQAVDLDSQSLTLTGGTGIDTTGSAQTMTFAIDSTVATLTGSQTLTNKILTSPAINTPTGDVATITGSQTLTNKILTSPTLTSPVINTAISGTAFKDEDTMSSDSATAVASQQSIKAYVDAVPIGDITSVVAGTGLTGGGTSGDVTLNVIGGTGIDANADDIAIDSSVVTLTGTQALSAKTLTSPVLNGTLSGTAFLDEDTLSSDSAIAVASQQSVKAYVDSQVSSVTPSSTTTFTNKTIDEDGVGNNITNLANASIKASAGIDATKIADGSVSDAEFQRLDGLTSDIQTQLDLKAALASPALTGNPTAPTQSASDNSTKLATTAYVDASPVGDLTAIVAGDGLTGTDLSGPIPTLNAVGGNGITANADALVIDTAVTVDKTTAQTLTNKTLTSPKINEDVAVSSTATELNLLDGATVVIPGKVGGTDFDNSLIVGHSTTGTLNAATYNTALGFGAMEKITSGDTNVAVGFSAGGLLTTGGDNTFLGQSAGYNQTIGISNTAIGKNSLYYAGQGGNNASYNTAVGTLSGDSIVQGDYNLCLGYNAGQNITSGTGNVIIGTDDATSATGDRQLMIAGYDGTTTTTWINGDSSGNISMPGTLSLAGGTDIQTQLDTKATAGFAVAMAIAL